MLPKHTHKSIFRQFDVCSGNKLNRDAIGFLAIQRLQDGTRPLDTTLYFSHNEEHILASVLLVLSISIMIVWASISILFFLVYDLFDFSISFAIFCPEWMQQLAVLYGLVTYINSVCSNIFNTLFQIQSIYKKWDTDFHSTLCPKTFHIRKGSFPSTSFSPFLFAFQSKMYFLTRTVERFFKWIQQKFRRKKQNWCLYNPLELNYYMWSSYEVVTFLVCHKTPLNQ